MVLAGVVSDIFAVCELPILGRAVLSVTTPWSGLWLMCHWMENEKTLGPESMLMSVWRRCWVPRCREVEHRGVFKS